MRKSVPDSFQRRQVASAMPFIFPGRKPTRPKIWCSRSKRAQERRKAVAGDWHEMEPRFTHKMVVKLSQPKTEAASGVMRGKKRAAWA